MKKLILVMLPLFILTACTSPNPYGNSYSSSETRTIQQVYYGTLVKIEPTTIDASTQTNAIASIAGAAVGAILGSKVGGGKGKDIATIGGGLLGSYAASKGTQTLGKTNGVNLTIKLDSGKVISIVQAVNPQQIFRVGEAVQVNVEGNTARVEPR